MRTFSVFGTTLHDLLEDELSARLLDVRGLVVTPNPEILLTARSNAPYRDLLNRAALALPDGIATVFAVAALYDVHDLHRHPGVDVVPMIATSAEQRGETLVIIGGYSEDHGKLLSRFRETHPALRMLCVDPGLIAEDRPELAPEHLDAIRNVGSSIVVVALGQGRGRVQGKQEIIANAILDAVPNVRFAIGVGGAIDVLSGRIHRAPKVAQRFGFEWLWRFSANPWRFLRIFRAVIIFPILIAWDTLQQGRLLRACRSVFNNLVVHFFSKSV
jgi:N-acetylglucosaminyldiphosphoundecaprenol N-acetyl-beta-D-mannosaminyltransferase